MKMSRFSEPQIIGILKQSDSDVSVAELCRILQMVLHSGLRHAV